MKQQANIAQVHTNKKQNKTLHYKTKQNTKTYQAKHVNSQYKQTNKRMKL